MSEGDISYNSINVHIFKPRKVSARHLRQKPLILLTLLNKMAGIIYPAYSANGNHSSQKNEMKRIFQNKQNISIIVCHRLQKRGTASWSIRYGGRFMECKNIIFIQWKHLTKLIDLLWTQCSYPSCKYYYNDTPHMAWILMIVKWGVMILCLSLAILNPSSNMVFSSCQQTGVAFTAVEVISICVQNIPNLSLHWIEYRNT